MKKIIMLVGTLLISTTCLANVQATNMQSSGLSTLGSAWNAAKSMHAKHDKSDLTKVYAGEDVSQQPTVANSISAA